MQLIPGKRAAGETAEGIPVRFTQKEYATYVILLGQPEAPTVTFKSLSVKPGTRIYLLGDADPLAWSQQGDNLRVDLPAAPNGRQRILVPHCWPGASALLRSDPPLPARTDPPPRELS